jgi:hypothetical protein
MAVRVMSKEDGMIFLNKILSPIRHWENYFPRETLIRIVYIYYISLSFYINLLG